MMNSAKQVDEQFAILVNEGMSKADLLWKLAELCLGWSYVWGALGEKCTPDTRRNYASRSVCPDGEKEQIRKKCQVLNGSKSSCTGCKYYPGDCTRIYDCRGFTRWCLKQVGISLNGAGATSQWNDNNNWVQKGRIEDLPAGQIACFFNQNGNKMEHTGFVLNGEIIHCSGEVKKERVYKKITHYAIPKGLGEPAGFPTLRKGDSGQYVTLLQTKLIQQGYDLSPYGADGKFGNKTLNAVLQFQMDHDLAADGIVGKSTWDAILSGTAVLYTVNVQHLSKKVATEIVNKYGGEMTREG